MCEAADRVGKSILATGNGRCNFSNVDPAASLYWNGEFVHRVFDALEQEFSAGAHASDNAVLRFFASLNLVWRQESEGKLYPLANKATVVLDVLRARARALGVQECCESPVVEVREGAGDGAAGTSGASASGCTLVLASGEELHAGAVVVACGGKGIERLRLPSKLARKLGKPVLGPLRVEETSLVKPLDNVRVRCAASLLDAAGVPLATEAGEVLFRPYGVSGIAIFNLSRLVERKGQTLELDFLPNVADADAYSFVMERATRCQELGYDVCAETVLRGLVLPPVAQVVAKAARVSARLPFRPRDGEALAHTLKHFALHVQGIGDERQCQVTRGGLEPRAFEVASLEACELPGLFACGEALDVDGPCGGYNLHWAWASGLLAGAAAARKVCCHD